MSATPESFESAFAKAVDLIEGTTYCVNLGGNKARISAGVIFMSSSAMIPHCKPTATNEDRD